MTFERFVQEVRTVGKLDHPNIVPIHDVGRDEDGGYYFVMKYVDGETVHPILRRLRAGDPETHRRWTFEGSGGGLVFGDAIAVGTVAAFVVALLA